MTERHAHPQPMTNSHILVNDFDYYEPTTLQDAVALLERRGAEAKILAGGTHLLVQLKMERENPAALINITKIPGLDEIAASQDGSLVIGACATIHEIRSHPVMRECYPALADACGSFGGTQIEIAATLGGNVCNGSPASDTVPALLVYEAELELVGPQGTRRLPLEKFLLGPGKTDRRPNEIVKAIHLPAPQPNSAGVFIKIARVAADLAKASLAVSVVRKGDTIVACRAAMGSVAPTVMRLRQAEAALAGQAFSPELLAQAGSLAAQEISPIDDTRSSAWYRRQIANVMLQDALTAAWQRPAAPAPSPIAQKNGRSLPVTPALLRDGKQEIELTVNGKQVRLMVRPNDLLLNVLRDQQNLTGAKYGCGIGECGACTVLIDGQAQMGCLVLAVAANGHEITTIEGLQGKDGALDPLQQQFIDDAAFQCGFCTPGFLMATKSLLKEIPHPSEAEVRDYLKGNRCRCTGYVSIVRAVMNYTNKNA